MRARSLLVPAASLAVVSGVVLQSSTAAFTATTGSTGSWAAGTISLSDNDLDSALFAETGLAPGQRGVKCLVVRYDGTASATVRMSGAITAPADGGLGNHLALTLSRVPAGHASCGDADATLPEAAFFQGTLATLAGTHGSYDTGVGSVPMTNAESHTYRIRWALPSDSVVQGKTVDAKFTWEARTA